MLSPCSTLPPLDPAPERLDDAAGGMCCWRPTESRQSKSLARVLTEKRMTLVVDDSIDVWAEDLPNLCLTRRFVGDKLDDGLQLLSWQLKLAHRAFYQDVPPEGYSYEATMARAPPSLPNVLRETRGTLLSGCTIALTGVVSDQREEHAEVQPLCVLIRLYGGEYTLNVDAATHLVARRKDGWQRSPKISRALNRMQVRAVPTPHDSRSRARARAPPPLANPPWTPRKSRATRRASSRTAAAAAAAVARPAPPFLSPTYPAGIAINFAERVGWCRQLSELVCPRLRRGGGVSQTTTASRAAHEFMRAAPKARKYVMRYPGALPSRFRRLMSIFLSSRARIRTLSQQHADLARSCYGRPHAAAPPSRSAVPSGRFGRALWRALRSKENPARHVAAYRESPAS